MKRCNNVVALAIAREMAESRNGKLKLPDRPTSTGSSKELRQKTDNSNNIRRSASLISSSSLIRQIKQGKYHLGEDVISEAARQRAGSASDSTKSTHNTDEDTNVEEDVRDFLTERCRVISPTCSTSISEGTGSTRDSLDSNIFSDNDDCTNFQLQRHQDWTIEDERKFNDVFMALDTNKDGILSFNELKDGAQLFGWNPTGTDISQYLDDMDLDGDDKVSKDEFRMYLQDLLSKLDHPIKVLEDSIDVMMQAVDTDGNGLCSKEEFKIFIQHRGDSPLTDADVDELFQQFDSDGDKSTLNKSELFRLLTEGMDLLV